jgi:PPOX class probable F420-dependent enzyme
MAGLFKPAPRARPYRQAHVRLALHPLDRHAGAMTPLPDDVRALFDGPNYAHVATLMPDGAPHSVPVWVGVEAGRIAFLTDPASRKARNLERDARVAISVTAHDHPFTMAGVRGRVTGRLEGDAAWEVIDRISHKYTGGPYPLRTDRVVLLVEPERAWAQAYG